MTAQWSLGLAATKLRPPTLPDRLVERSRLDDVLSEELGGQAKLVLASAPAGSGKSTLVAAWLNERPEQAAWLQVEANDSDPVRYWLNLIEAVGQPHPGIAESMRPVVVGSNGDEQAVVSALVNKLDELTESLVIVIDDYHLISNTSVHLGMERLIELSPATVKIVLCTRVDPPFRLGRLRVRNQISELRADDFRFTSAEASGLLTAADEPLEQSIIEQLCDRTEGWAAGLVLAGLSLQRSPDHEQFIRGFHGDDQLVVDYMTDEFLAGVSEDDRQRLLQTSVLEQFNGALVDAVAETSDGADWLKQTAKVNQLLISLDQTGSWYRYHHLLRDLLRLEARQTLPDQLDGLHRRAAAWFEANGDLGQAITHYLAADDRHEAAKLMYVHGGVLMAGSQIETLRSLLDAIGDAARTDAACSLYWGWCEYIAGRYSEADEWVATTHQVAGTDFDPVVTAPLRMNLLLARGDVSSAFAVAREFVANDRVTHHTSDLATVIGGVYTWAGQADEARQVLVTAIEKTADEAIQSAHLLSLIYQAINEFDDRGDTRAAEVVLETADQLGMATYYRIAPAYAIRARAQTDSAAALRDVNHAVDLARKIPGDLALAFVLTACADTLLDLDDASGEALLIEARLVIDRCSDPGIAGRFLARIESRHQLGARDTNRAEALVEQLTERETAVLRYLPTKLSQRDIASELYVSLNTVKTHCAAIYRKLGVGDRKAAVQTARDHDLL